MCFAASSFAASLMRESRVSLSRASRESCHCSLRSGEACFVPCCARRRSASAPGVATVLLGWWKPLHGVVERGESATFACTTTPAETPSGAKTTSTSAGATQTGEPVEGRGGMLLQPWVRRRLWLDLPCAFTSAALSTAAWALTSEVPPFEFALGVEEGGVRGGLSPELFRPSMRLRLRTAGTMRGSEMTRGGPCFARHGAAFFVCFVQEAAGTRAFELHDGFHKILDLQKQLGF